MAKAQNSPRGLFWKESISIGAAGTTGKLTADGTGNILLDGGLGLSGETTDIITQDSTAVKMASGLALSGQASSNAITQDTTGVTLPDGLYLSAQTTNPLTQNSGGFILGDTAAPSGDSGGAFVHGSNSTGHYIKLNESGTTWVFLNTTSVQPS